MESHARVLDLKAYEQSGNRGAAHVRPPVPLNAGSPSLLMALDTLDQGLVFMDSMGREQHANPAFLKELANASDGALLRSHVALFAQTVWGKAACARLGQQVERLDARVIPGARGAYRLTGTYIGGELFGMGASVMVALDLPQPDPFDADRLRARFNLTRKQASVARLVAQGLRNDEIAQRLFLSTHTVRHHIEQIRMRVGGHTRAAIADRIRSSE